MLKARRDGDQLTLTMARADRGNCLSPELVEALLEGVVSASADSAVSTLVLRAEGRDFCTGLDLSDLETSSDADWLWRLVRIETLLDALWRSPLATVALAHGRAWGAGADLFVACERRVAAPDTSFRFPGAQFGIVLGTRRLAERVGVDAARALVISGVTLDAAAAQQAGIATWVGTTPDGPPSLLSPTTAAQVRSATRRDNPDADLAALVRSAAEPGLKARMQAYRNQVRASGRGAAAH